jgi:GH15 family glucan-1,4-alpha-glucosidase
MASEARSLRPSDKDAIVSAPFGDGQAVLATVNKYPGVGNRDWRGALIEDTSAFRMDVDQFYDVHTLVWDAELGQTMDVRNDAVGSDVAYRSGRVPEIRVTNDFAFDAGTGTLEQDVLVSVDAVALFVRNRARFSLPHRRTLYTVVGLGIRDLITGDDVDEAYVTRRQGYDFVVAQDGTRYLAVCQRRSATGQTTFDGSRVGRQGRDSGPERSAWADVYVEGDGAIEPNDHLRGKVDAGVGLDVGDAVDATWTTAIGFGESEPAAIENALTVQRNGYDAERSTFRAAWESWHENHAGCPLSDSYVTETYDRSMTSMKCAQDRNGAIVAGAFQPQDFAYRYVWPRDLVAMIQALLAGGSTTEAAKALNWLHRAQVTDDRYDDRGINRIGTWWQNYYSNGVPHWTALQLDQVGGPIYAHWLLWRVTGDDSLLEAHYEMSEQAADFLLRWDNGDGFPKRHQDPWEEIWGYTTEGSAAAIAGLRSMSRLARAAGDPALARRCSERAERWRENFDAYCFAHDALLGDHYVTAACPEWPDHPPADQRPDAAAFMAYWPWNVLDADSDQLRATVRHADDARWRADRAACVGRYPGDDYTPTATAEDGGWPLCEAYADVVRWQTGLDPDAVADHVYAHSRTWRTAAGLLPERVDGEGRVRWNSNLQWSQATYVLLVESLARGEPFGMAPAE